MVMPPPPATTGPFTPEPLWLWPRDRIEQGVGLTQVQRQPALQVRLDVVALGVLQEPDNLRLERHTPPSVASNAAIAASSSTQRSSPSVSMTRCFTSSAASAALALTPTAWPWLSHHADHDHVQALAQQRVGPATGWPVADRAAALERTRHGDHVQVVGAVDVGAVGHRGGINRAAVTATGSIVVNILICLEVDDLDTHGSGIRLTDTYNRQVLSIEV